MRRLLQLMFCDRYELAMENSKLKADNAKLKEKNSKHWETIKKLRADKAKLEARNEELIDRQILHG